MGEENILCGPNLYRIYDLSHGHILGIVQMITFKTVLLGFVFFLIGLASGQVLTFIDGM